MAPTTPPIPGTEMDSFEVFRGYSAKDALLFAPSIVILVMTGVFGPAIINALPFNVQGNFIIGPAVGVAILWGLIAAALVITTEDHYTPFEWAMLHARHLVQPDEYLHEEEKAEFENREATEQRPHNPLTRILATNQKTQDVTGVNGVFSSSHSDGPGAVEMTDGTMAGIVRVYPANLSLAEMATKIEAVKGLTNAVNRTNFDFKIHYTTRDFDIESYLEPFAERRTDDDIQNSSTRAAVLDDFLAWYPQEIASQGTKKAEFYVVIGVEEREVKHTASSPGITDQLSEIRPFSFVLSGADDDTHEDVIRGRQRRKLAERLDKMKGRLREIDGVDAEVGTAEQHVSLIAEAWQREEYEPTGAFQPTPVGTALPDTEV